MSRWPWRRRGLLFLGLLACTCWLAGCGPGKPPSGTVSGKVTLGGKPLIAGVVTLTNSKLGVGASGALDEFGAYRVAGELRTGEYEVAVQPPPAPPPLEMPKTPAPAATVNIPQKFRDAKTSGLKATIKPGANTADFDL